MLDPRERHEAAAPLGDVREPHVDVRQDGEALDVRERRGALGPVAQDELDLAAAAGGAAQGGVEVGPPAHIAVARAVGQHLQAHAGAGAVDLVDQERQVPGHAGRQGLRGARGEDDLAGGAEGGHERARAAPLGVSRHARAHGGRGLAAGERPVEGVDAGEVGRERVVHDHGAQLVDVLERAPVPVLAAEEEAPAVDDHALGVQDAAPERFAVEEAGLNAGHLAEAVVRLGVGVVELALAQEAHLDAGPRLVLEGGEDGLQVIDPVGIGGEVEGEDVDRALGAFDEVEPDGGGVGQLGQAELRLDRDRLDEGDRARRGVGGGGRRHRDEAGDERGGRTRRARDNWRGGQAVGHVGPPVCARR